MEEHILSPRKEDVQNIEILSQRHLSPNWVLDECIVSKFLLYQRLESQKENDAVST